MLRCIKFYQAITEVRNLLHQIIEVDHLVRETMLVADNYALDKFADGQDKEQILGCLRALEKLQKRISRFLHEHKLFTTFVYKSKEH